MINLLGLAGKKAPIKKFNVRFLGRELILVGSKKQGGLYTPKQLEKHEVGNYYLYDDNKIRSNGTVVGTIKDIEFI
jgi:hypothetical protein